MKKNILLTIWLLLPITIVSLLMVWIFYSLDKDRLMADAPPVGAGAGDTGNANALGQWLAGRDADAVSRALDARREGIAIDPRDWPGGVEVRVPLSSFHQGKNPLFGLVDNKGKFHYCMQGKIGEDETRSVVFPQERLVNSTVYCGNGFGEVEVKKLSFGRYRILSVTDYDGHKLKPILLQPQIPDPNLQVSDPMVVEVRIGSVYED